jgi:hypothetical protein
MIEQEYIDRFFEYVSPEAITGCWLWTGRIDSDGYGRIQLNRIRYGAHRFSAMIYGLDMSGAVMRHMCNNPSCVNPDHLVTGSIKDNTLDMLTAKRQAKGSVNGNAKLLEDQVIDIRNKHSAGETINALAEEYKVSSVMIRNIIKRKNWSHV